LSDSHHSWRKIYALAQEAPDPARRRELCAQARRLIQDRQLQLATSSRIDEHEVAELEAALRALWELEEGNKS
jgi:hypothetical protein